MSDNDTSENDDFFWFFVGYTIANCESRPIVRDKWDVVVYTVCIVAFIAVVLFAAVT